MINALGSGDGLSGIDSLSCKLEAIKTVKERNGKGRGCSRSSVCGAEQASEAIVPVFSEACSWLHVKGTLFSV